MKTHRTLARTAAVLLAVSAAACSASAPEGEITARSQERLVAPAVTEAVAVLEHIRHAGVAPSSLEGMHVGSLGAVDFTGRQFVRLVFLAKDASIASPLTFDTASADLDGAAAAVVGATTDRARMSTLEEGLDLLGSIQRTVAALGGPSRLKRIVAAQSTVFLAEDVDGQHWDVGSASKVEASRVQEMKDAFTAMVKGLAPEIRDMLHEDWNATLGEGAVDEEAARTITSADGHLDLGQFIARFAETEVPAAAGTKTQAVTRGNTGCYTYWLFGDHTLCRSFEEGRFDAALESRKQAHRAIQTREFPVKDCVTGQLVASAPQGCGPAMFTSLVWRAWVDGSRFTSLPARPTDASVVNGFASRSYDPRIDLTIGKRADTLMKSCYFVSGTATTPWDIESGGRAWLTENRSTLQLKTKITLSAANAFDAQGKLDVLRARVRDGRGAVAAGFPVTGDIQYHYAPVASYRAVFPYNGGVRPSSLELYIKGFDQGQSTDKWQALHDPFAAFAALYWLE